MSRVKILFDIDGVLNPYLMAGLPEGYIQVNEGWISWRIDLMQHATWMRDLAKRADIIWASSWEEESNVINSYYGLDDYFPHITFDFQGEGTAKLASIREFLAGDTSPVIWLEDEDEADAHAWAASRPNTLIIHCDPSVGWTREQYQQVLEFLDTNA